MLSSSIKGAALEAGPLRGRRGPLLSMTAREKDHFILEVKTMADLTYAINLDEDEIILLIQLLSERLVELEREHPSSPDTPVRPPAALRCGFQRCSGRIQRLNN